jgi:hypothetical protein
MLLWIRKTYEKESYAYKLCGINDEGIINLDNLEILDALCNSKNNKCKSHDEIKSIINM